VRPGQQQGHEKKTTESDEPTDHALGRSRGGFGTKIHVICDNNGIPLAHVVSPGQDHDNKFVRELLSRVSVRSDKPGRPRTRPKQVNADKAYSARNTRELLKKRGIRGNIPFKSNDKNRRWKFDKLGYRQRNIIERLIGWTKEKRRIGTRYEKLATTFSAMIDLSFVQRCFRVYLSDRA